VFPNLINSLRSNPNFHINPSHLLLESHSFLGCFDSKVGGLLLKEVHLVQIHRQLHLLVHPHLRLNIHHRCPFLRYGVCSVACRSDIGIVRRYGYPRGVGDGSSSNSLRHHPRYLARTAGVRIICLLMS
jgi:hypothetical protein